MNNKLKKIIIPFILMIIFNLGSYLTISQNFGGGYSPHVGLLLISGLLLGPYGAFGSVIGNAICDLVRGYNPQSTLLSAIASLAISYLAYKLWYENYNGKIQVTKPKLNNTNNILLFLGIILICGSLYVILHVNMLYFIYPSTRDTISRVWLSYFVNFINSSFLFGIIGIWLSKKFNFFEIPTKSNKKSNPKIYSWLLALLIILTISSLVLNQFTDLDNYLRIFEFIILIIFIYAFLTKPMKLDIVEVPSNSIPENIMNRFFIITIILIIVGSILARDRILIDVVDYYLPATTEDIVVAMLLITDVLLLIFLIPSLSVLRYIEKKVIKPITSFSQIEHFIQENEKIEYEGLLKIYSNYLTNNDEIGILARSYSDLIKHNNNYIENIQKIEGEKERIKAELDIATEIQQSNLPLEALENEHYFVDGYSHPAKEVGGDFFDYYKLNDENIAIVIGDASGKGVPAALLATITQVMIKQLFFHETDPSKILYSLNNQLCENNPLAMFITLWVGIYNINTHKLIFANAGHNPPLIKRNNKFEYLSIDQGIVLGIMEEFEFKKQEILLDEQIVVYTDGITDANNENQDMYGEDNLLKFFNNYKSNNNPIEPLLKDINKFTHDEEQFDDMTILFLKIKHD